MERITNFYPVNNFFIDVSIFITAAHQERAGGDGEEFEVRIIWQNNAGWIMGGVKHGLSVWAIYSCDLSDLLSDPGQPFMRPSMAFRMISKSLPDNNRGLR